MRLHFPRIFQSSRSLRRKQTSRNRSRRLRRLMGWELLESRELLAVVLWDGGGGDLNWSNPFNWNHPFASDPNTLPGPTDDVVIDIVGSTVSILHDVGADFVHGISNQENLTISGGSLTIGSASQLGQAVVVQAGTTLTVSGQQSMSSLSVAGTVTHAQGEISGVNLQVAEAFIVQAGGRIDVSAKGYRGGSRDGNPSDVGETRGTDGAATTDGGAGWQAGGSYGSLADGPTNAMYGNETAPHELGSGGGGSPGFAGGNGGGLIHITATNAVIDGDLLSDGGGGGGQPCCSIGGGGGSGGAIHIAINGGAISGSGIIRADRGGGFGSTPSGGRGRIAVTGFSSNTFTGTLGRAATIFVQQSGTGGTLSLDGTILSIGPGETRTYGAIESANSTSTIFNRGTLALTNDSLTIPNLVTFVHDGIVKGAQRLEPVIGSFTIATGGTVTHTQGQIGGVNLHVAGQFTVQSGGKIDVSAKGYRGGSRDGNTSENGETHGPGGAATTEGGAGWQAGGTYGSLADGPTNALYGDETAPHELGSGGGGSPGFAGGNGVGLIQVSAASAVIDGDLLADGGGGGGQPCCSIGGGGGSGGAIHIAINGGTISGSGIIRADRGGGFGSTPSGGRGRIAVTGFSSSTFTSTLGRAATIFVRQIGTGGDLTLDNTTVNIAPGTTHSWSSVAAVNGPSTIWNQGTLAAFDDAFAVNDQITLIQDGVVKGIQRATPIIGSFTVASGGVVTHSLGSPAGAELHVENKLTVHAGGKIDVSSKGYRGGSRDGNPSEDGETRGENGVATTVGGATWQGGGSYGSPAGGPTNAMYGNEKRPSELGSGGGGASSFPAGNGGGLIRLFAGSVQIDGELLADGGNGGGQPCCSVGGGGGSGGGIWIDLQGGLFTGAGTIRAQQGFGFGSTPAGGRGRIAVTGFSDNEFSGVLGRAGTLFLQREGTDGILSLDNTVLTVTPGQSQSWGGITTINGPSTINNEGTIELTNLATSVDVASGDLILQQLGASAAFRSRGTIHTGANRLFTVNGGDMSLATIDGPGTLDLNTSLVVDGDGGFTSQPIATAVLSGNLTGATSFDLFDPQGTLQFDGNGNTQAPQLLEAMSRDLGSSSAAYGNNFSFGALTLANNTRLKLVDDSDNSVGPGAEAVYVNYLQVPAGTTLDLNGLQLYARVAQIAGTVEGGTVTTLDDGGQLPFGVPVSGHLSAIDEADEWTFFGRKGREVSIYLNLGAGDPPTPLSPQLPWGEIQLLDPDGNLLTSSNNNAHGANTSASIAGQELPQDGTYRIRIVAPAIHAESVGRYTLIGRDITKDVNPLILGQPAFGKVETPLSLDEWTFSATAGTQVQLDLLAAFSPRLVFTLTGPGDYIGFTDLNTDSSPITLPTSGNYKLTVRGVENATGDYSFRMLNTIVIDLPINSSHTGTIAGSHTGQLFRVDMSEAKSLRIELDDSSSANHNELYARFGSPPTRSEFVYRGTELAASDQSLLIPSATPGSWYILVYGEFVSTPGSFVLSATTYDIDVASITPVRQPTGAQVAMTITGSGFTAGAATELVASDGTTYAATSTDVDSFTQITASFDLSGVPQGIYSVRITRPGGLTDTLEDSFTVTATGEAHLETELILPSDLGRHAVATLYVRYTNTGNASMPAPILVLQSADPDDSDKPLLSLEESGIVEGFWTSAIPDGFDNQVQILASGVVAGILHPGESALVPVYYAGLLQPWDMSDTSIELEIRIHEAGNSTAIDWNSFKESVRPEWIALDAWDAVFDNLMVQIGPIWGDYARTIAENAAYLGRLGQNVSDVSSLFALELQQAAGISPIGTLSRDVDLVLSAPGLALKLDRHYENRISTRYHRGLFGIGWSSSWESKLEFLPDGTIGVRESAESYARFQPDSRTPGVYFSPAGTTTTLMRLQDGSYEFTGTSGAATHYHSDGRLDYVQDANGNRITVGYSDGHLSSLSHSSGDSLTLAYSAAGLVESVTDSTGRIVTYGYDATNTYLIAVTSAAGTVRYAYETAGAPAQRHALLAEERTDGVTRRMTYDDRGRLTSLSVDGNPTRLDFTYDEFGRVTTTDSFGVVQHQFYDHRGLIVRSENGKGQFTTYQYNDDLQLVGEANDQGRSRSYEWCGCGHIKEMTDELGNVVRFLIDQSSERPFGFVDAAGITTTFEYDSANNLTATTYADGTRDQVIFDGNGNPSSTINRRGQAVNLTYNDRGLLQTQTFPDGTTINSDYDDRGRLIAVTEPRGTTSFTYDSADRLLRIDLPAGRWLEYAYDSAGRRIRMEDSSGFVTKYLFDPAGQLIGLRDGANQPVVDYVFDATGRLVRENKPNGTYSTVTHDSLGRVATLIHHAPDGSINSSFSYEYNAAGERVGMTTLDGSWSYTYDLLGQLIDAKFVSASPAITDQQMHYEYDNRGNRVRTLINGVATDYVANSLNQVVSAGETRYTYDADGNLIEENGPNGKRTFTYDVLNRLAAVQTSAGTWQYEYDSFGNRTAMTINGERTEYLFDFLQSSDVIAEFDADGTRTASYVRGLGLTGALRGDEWAYYDFDALGSTVGMSGPAGTYQNQYAYSPFGEALYKQESITNTFEFVGASGVMQDDHGLQWMRTRYYDPQLGRFVSQDPARLKGGDFNQYRYATNSPILFTDVGSPGTELEFAL